MVVRKAKQLWQNTSAKANAATFNKMMSQIDGMIKHEMNPHKLAKVREAVLENLPKGFAEATKEEEDGHRAARVGELLADMQADHRWRRIRAKLQITDAELKEVQAKALKLAGSRSGGRFNIGAQIQRALLRRQA